MDNYQIIELARSRAREILSQNISFRNMSVQDQKRMYQQVVDEQLNKIKSGENGLSEGLLFGNKINPNKKSSSLLDDERHERGFGDSTDSFEDLVNSVDFPQFVKELLQSVFDANISVMKAQTDDYIRLMKEATTGLAKFIKQIDDTTTFAYLAENNSDEFNISMEEDEDGSEKMSLTNPQGEQVDMEDNEVKAKIMDAKIKMAQEHRAALREMILMGITRLVVEKGEVSAEVHFELNANRQIEKKDKALVKTANSTGSSRRIGGGFLGGIFGGPKAGHTRSTRQTQMSISSTKSLSEDDLKAKLKGKVNIQFKTDYFKLDNFAQMYAPPSAEEQQAALGQPKVA